GETSSARSRITSGDACTSPRRFLLLPVRVRRLPVRITSKGEVTIAADSRERAGLLPHTEVDFEFDGKVVRIVRAKAGKKDGRGARVVAHLRGRGDVAMSTDAIMALTCGDGITAIQLHVYVLLDVMSEHPRWLGWSAEAIVRAADQ